MTTLFHTIAGMLLLCAASQIAAADTETPTTRRADTSDEGKPHSQRGLRSMSVGFEVLSFADSFRGTVRQHGGEARAESLMLGLDYGLNDQWSLSASIPLIRKRYRGSSPHVPARLDPPNNTAPFIDDGDFHGGWQDFRLGLHYHTVLGRYLLAPYLVAHVPSRDYPHFGQAAIGQNLHKFQFGIAVGRAMETLPFYYRLDLSHTLVERTLGQRVDHSIGDLTLGWFATDQIAFNVFFRKKSGRGVEPTNRAFFGRPPFRNEAWYQHDRLFPHEYELVGGGAEWSISPRYAVGASYSEMVGGNYVQRIDSAWSFTLTRFFSR